MNPARSLPEAIEDLLRQAGPTDQPLDAVLERVLDHFQCVVGTIHSLDPDSGLLQLQAFRGLPESFLGRIRTIPIGKGMAGLAAQRLEPVQVCNLQTDTSGAARPGAKEAAVEGSIAIPMLPDATLRGVLGVAKPVAYEFSATEIGLLQQIADAVGRFLGKSPPS